MNKPWVIWSFSALIALLVFGAMGVITRHTLGLEKDRSRAEAKAELEERTRLALWRMDTAAAGVLVEENNRPSWHFQDVDLSKEMQPSPLNLDVPDNIRLHFEVQNGEVTTPQVNGWSVPAYTAPAPGWGDRQGQISQGKSLSKFKLNDLKLLKDLLRHDGTYQGWQKKRNALSELADNNLGVICAVAQRGTEDWKSDQNDQLSWDAKVAVAQEQRMNNPKNDIRNVDDYQGNYNAAEKAKRNEIVKKSSNTRAKGVGQQSQTYPTKPDSKNPVVRKPLPPLPPLPPGVKPQQDQAELPSGQGSRVRNPLVKPDADAALQGGAQWSSLTPVWIGSELLLVREVQDAAGKRIQGVWLDSEAIRESLLKDIADLLPGAQLEPVRQSLKVLLGEEKSPHVDDPMVMAALPWRLLPGEVAMVEPVGWTPMHKTLAVAWVGAVLAALAAVALMRGVVKLSERRASFVSSVTHELRTPLTTFSLYSDMLAEGMVLDEDKRQGYLHTLKKESARLTHLVENVLAYSRIERGSARARVETIRVGTLVDRMLERLESRAHEVGMKIRCDVPTQAGECEIKVDTTAVEQIIFNLVDNACKYAVTDGGDEACRGEIELRVLEQGQKSKGLVFQVCDQGPGIAKAERKKLFRAFHKSAQEAAHSKPGVGLGLALCRRLARALGGDLKIVDCEQGACFELRLG